MRRAAVFAVLCMPALCAAVPNWRLTRSDHFEIYAQASDQRAREILKWFEQLRAFFEQNGAPAEASSHPVRVVVFASEQEYQPYRLRSAADAYYVGGAGQDYIVMGTDDPSKFGLAAHEYAHLVLRASDDELPSWLKEGLAEFFATLRITPHGTELGGVLPSRLQTLQRRAWTPLPELLALSDESQKHLERSSADLFYAESWALTEMLILSPKYAPGLQKFLASPAGLDAESVAQDLQRWIGQPKLPVIQLPEVITAPVTAQVSDVREPAVRLLLAQVLLGAGEFDRAETSFHALPDSAETSAALGSIALHKGDRDGARRYWKRAIDQSVADPRLCYNYAILADQAGLSPDEIRPALQRAIALRPDFDDARYQLALLEKNAGRYDAAIEQFRAMRVVPAARAYAYWMALADTFNEVGRRDEARSAASHASDHASTPAERARAAQQTYIAQTDPSVQFARDASGQLQLVTTRMPHQQTDWNPFIEPGDDMHRIQGQLREIDCGTVTTIRVEAASQLVTLVIPDLKHVQIRHSPAEFICGPQSATPVIVDYAKTAGQGLVRAMDFNPAGAP